MDNHKIKQVKTFFKNEPVEVVYLFGSQAGGRVGPMSDYDFAVLFKDRLTTDQRFNKRLKYIGFFIKLCKTDKVDVVDLLQAPVFLSYEAVKPKKPLYISSIPIKKQFEKQTIDNYLDRHYYIRQHTTLSLERLRREYGIKT